jgi:hypothetical protein
MAGRALPRVTRRGGLGRGLWPDHKGVITHDDATATYRLAEGARKRILSHVVRFPFCDQDKTRPRS